MQTAFNHWRAGALLWTLGLDGLLAAEKRDVFVSRLDALLGKDTLVFPTDVFGRQPSYTVGQLGAGVYDLRNLLAHGKEVLEKYRRPIEFDFEPTELPPFGGGKWTDEALIHEGSLFLTAAVLRKVIIDGHLDSMANKRQWEKWLDSL